MNFIFRIVRPLLFITFAILFLGCQSSQIIMNQPAGKYQPLPADTPVYFYDHNYNYGSINTQKKALVLRAVCISGKTAAIVDSGYFTSADKRPPWDGIGYREEYEKAYPFSEELVKALFEELYIKKWKPFVPNKSYIWIGVPGKEDMDALSPFKAVKVVSAEMRYSGPELKDWKPREFYQTRDWDYNDLPKIADAALKHGSNIVILDSVFAEPRKDEKGEIVYRKVEVRRTWKDSKDYKRGDIEYNVTTYDVEYENRLIFAWWSGKFDLIRIEGLLKQKP